MASASAAAPRPRGAHPRGAVSAGDSSSDVSGVGAGVGAAVAATTVGVESTATLTPLVGMPRDCMACVSFAVMVEDVSLPMRPATLAADTGPPVLGGMLMT
mmetsp:Transcript_45003/g.130186  ORF Transcript_45003/g.130186 Transcript_45003/m.130186 type:complete len:101 (+) Transcript_45003:152-454(+)